MVLGSYCQGEGQVWYKNIQKQEHRTKFLKSYPGAAICRYMYSDSYSEPELMVIEWLSARFTRNQKREILLVIKVHLLRPPGMRPKWIPFSLSAGCQTLQIGAWGATIHPKSWIRCVGGTLLIVPRRCKHSLPPATLRLQKILTVVLSSNAVEKILRDNFGHWTAIHKSQISSETFTARNSHRCLLGDLNADSPWEDVQLLRSSVVKPCEPKCNTETSCRFVPFFTRRGAA